ncbi:MAG: hypothetical protein JST87_03230 [Bacteroidetes bacterium]|nr:hypothetical protein [Bacteroidota bacterium]
MKTLYTILFIFFSQTLFANDIDKLTTNEDVNNFLFKKINKQIKDHPVLESKSTDTLKYGLNKFFKVDLDNNHLTDLIINGKHLMVVLDKGKGNYELQYLDRSAPFLFSTKLISIDAESFPEKIIILQSKHSSPDTLIYKFERFVEYNPYPATDFIFEKITFKTERCPGQCPVFEMQVNKDHSVAYNAGEYNLQLGSFQGVLDDKEFKELIDVLKYLPIEKLKDKYAVEWKDDQTAATKISYNGKSKMIVDYGEAGSFGLAKLYSLFFEWRNTTEWLRQ